MNSINTHTNSHFSAQSKIIKIDQRRIVRSIRDKCDLVDHLYKGSRSWVMDANRNHYNNGTIEDLISTARHMMTLIEDDYEYMEAAHTIETVLLKMNRFTEAAMLYSDPEEQVHH